MEITDVRIRLSSKGGSRVKAFATITLDDVFVVRDMRIIEGRNGLFVAMPSRPLKEPCPKCGYRNPVRSKYCAGCGGEFTIEDRSERDDRSLHRDVAHPITQEMRDYIHNKIIEAYKLELEKSTSEPAPTLEEKETPEVEQSKEMGSGEEPKAEEESSEEIPPIIEEETTEEQEKSEETTEEQKEPKEKQPEEKDTEEGQEEEETEEEQPEEKKSDEEYREAKEEKKDE